MNSRTTRWWTAARRFLGSRYLPLLLLLVLLAGFGYWVMPRLTSEIVSVDGAARWAQSDAPPRRSIVWEPAVPMELPQAGLAPEDSLIRPQLAEGGTVLYFTLRKAEQGCDIYRSRLAGGAWQPAEPVSELNTTADDVGPAIAADGRRLYLYSNRPGGFGGFDVYVSERTADGWSEPRNLGPRINSPAHEYDPAVSADRLRLFFASNRTPRMTQQAVEGELDERAEHWDTTLRVDMGLTNFDLYVAQRPSPDDDWPVAEPLAGVNRSDSNEGAPCLSPRGTFLYFVSDRPWRSGEAGNFDVYRARFQDGRLSRVENLGGGVNTPANEIEPALSPEGFRLFFSRNRPDEPDRQGEYALYSSTATEVVDEAAWDTSRWASFLAFLSSIWWWLVLGLLILALLAALAWYLREVSLGRATVPGFLLTALIVHILLGLGSFYVYFGEDILAQIKKGFRQVVVATRLSGDGLHQSHEPGSAPWEKVADLTALETLKPADVARQVTEMPNLPVPIDSPVPAIPLKLQRVPPPDRLVAMPPKSIPDTTDSPELQRHRPALDDMPADLRAELEQPAAAQRPTETQASRLDVKLERRVPSPQPAGAPKMLPRRTVEPAAQLAKDDVRVERIETAATPAQTSRQPSIRRASHAPAAPLETPQVATEEVAPAPDASPADAQPGRLSVTIERRPTGLPRAAGIGTILPQQTLARAGAGPKPVRDERALQRLSEAAPAVGASPRPATLPRAAHARLEPAAGPAVMTEEVEVSEAAPEGEGRPERIAVDLGQRQAARFEAGIPRALPGATVAAGAEARAFREELTVQQVGDQPRGIPAAGKPVHLPRAARTPIESAPGPRVRIRQLASLEGVPETPPSGPGPVAGLAVSLPRRQPAGETARVSGLLPAKTTDAAMSRPRVTEGGLDRPEGSSAVPASTTAESPLPAQRQVAADSLVADAAPQIKLTRPPVAAGSAAPSRPASPAGVQVGVDRPEPRPLEAAVKTAGDVGGPHSARNPRLVIGGLEAEKVDAAPSFSPLASRILRRPARAPVTLYAEDNIGLQAMFRLRDDESKRDLVEAFGGSDETLAAVRLGLAWLKKHQHEGGHWSLHEFYNKDKGQSYSGKGSVRSDTAATGFGLLPFLGDGHTHQSGDYQSTVKKGLQHLLARQSKEGELTDPREGNSRMYAHAIAAIALCEAYGMTRDAALRGPAQRSIDFIASAQHKPSGGWRYQPNQAADTSVVGWQVMALKSGQMAALDVPQPTLELVKKWLRSVEGQGSRIGTFGYQNRSATPAMTAEALLCLEYLNTPRDDPHLQAGARYLLEHLPRKGQESSYYWYYGTQVMYHLQGDYWPQWNRALRDMLVKSQIKKGSLAGTWDAKDQWESSGGRVYATSLRLLMLEVYYRHLPLYQLFEQ